MLALAKMTEAQMKPVFFFATQSDFHAWLAKHHDTTQELWVGFYKKSSGKPSITWPEAVDEVLCFGWIDGVRRSIDPISYTIRFTPRKPRSIWTAVNINRAKELIGLELMGPAGLKAFRELAEERSAVYSYEQRKTARLDDGYEQRFRANKEAWRFFQARPP